MKAFRNQCRQCDLKGYIIAYVYTVTQSTFNFLLVHHCFFFHRTVGAERLHNTIFILFVAHTSMYLHSCISYMSHFCISIEHSSKSNSRRTFRRAARSFQLEYHRSSPFYQMETNGADVASFSAGLSSQTRAKTECIARWNELRSDVPRYVPDKGDRIRQRHRNKMFGDHVFAGQSAPEGWSPPPGGPGLLVKQKITITQPQCGSAPPPKLMPLEKWVDLWIVARKISFGTINDN